MSFDRPTEVDTYEQLRADIVAGVRTALPGIVKAYDPAKRTAMVQPARRGKATTGVFDLSPISAAPVLWPRFGGFVMVGKLNPGDPVLVVVSDRELDQWLLTGAPYDPKTTRRHELTDAMVLPSPPGPSTKPITVGSAGAELYIGREDGTAGVSMTAAPVPGVTTIEGIPIGGIMLGGAASSPAMLGDTVAAAFTTWTGAVATAGSTWTGAGPPTAASNGAFIGSVITATAALATSIANWLSAKVLIE